MIQISLINLKKTFRPEQSNNKRKLQNGDEDYSVPCIKKDTFHIVNCKLIKRIS